MISAGQTDDASLRFGTDEGAAVPANVVERIDGRFVAAHDDDGFIADLVEKIIALVAHPVDMAGNDPLTADDLVHVRLEHGIVAVELAIQAVADLGVCGQPRDYSGFGFTHDVTSDFNSSRGSTRHGCTFDALAVRCRGSSARRAPAARSRNGRPPPPARHTRPA